MSAVQPDQPPTTSIAKYTELHQATKPNLDPCTGSHVGFPGFLGLVSFNLGTGAKLVSAVLVFALRP
ncbi:hypothetical protein SNOG_00130 [Parastagonospora nodorum SN15]|uniref:Uncharacterized protein n=1 Tax=Phaeosphaeria nodorum (strain SN15 / ATCC MYA-4574 / FGSC 10173) TaxID=321614 RepID=Q0V784_PHANO|nr:hypothetical protein SNOG_00130 [Parastagonospora nodorum SN15]EAT91625.1 hypothetical protein SNOG_00130 [Parastagonospora nodorum SN15]